MRILNAIMSQSSNSNEDDSDVISLGSRDTDVTPEVEDEDDEMRMEDDEPVDIPEDEWIARFVDVIVRLADNDIDETVRALDDMGVTVLNVIRRMEVWFLGHYVSHCADIGKDGEQCSTPSMPVLVWIAMCFARFGLNGNIMIRRLRPAQCVKLLDLHIRNTQHHHRGGGGGDDGIINTSEKWTTGDEELVFASILEIEDPSVYIELLDMAARVCYWHMMWYHITSNGGQYGMGFEFVESPTEHDDPLCNELLGDPRRAVALEWRMGNKVKNYEDVIDPDVDFVGNGRTLVTKILCCTGSVVQYRMDHATTIQRLSQVTEVNALLISDVSDDIHVHLANVPGCNNSRNGVVAGWLLYAFIDIIRNAETSHQVHNDVKTKKKRSRTQQQQSYGRGYCVCITNFEWGREHTAPDRIVPAKATGDDDDDDGVEMRWPVVVQFKDRWFVANYKSGRLIYCGRNTPGGVMRACSCWLRIIDTQFNGRLPSGAEIPCQLDEPIDDDDDNDAN